MKITRIGVVGAGTMGSGIAQAAAQAGFNVVLFDIKSEVLKNAHQSIQANLAGALTRGKISEKDAIEAMNRISFTEKMEEVLGELIIEAVVENLSLKAEIFRTLAMQNASTTILASNTSSFPITQIAQGINHPGRIAGMHFFNPVHIMKLVEIISGEKTTVDTTKTIRDVAIKMGKVPVFAKDAPGFIVNRVARQYYLESLNILEDEVAGFEIIDKLMEATGFKMGPFRLMDLIGIDSNQYTTQSMYKSFNNEPRFQPSSLQQKMVEDGLHGRKSKRGFYDYS